MSIINIDFGGAKREREKLAEERLKIQNEKTRLAMESNKVDEDRRYIIAGKLFYSILGDDSKLDPWLYSNEYTAADRWISLLGALELVKDMEYVDELRNLLTQRHVHL